MGNPGTTELVIYAENDANLYHRVLSPIHDNLLKHVQRGVYDRSLSLRSWRRYADRAAQEYCRVFCAPDQVWYRVFPPCDRKEAADYFADCFEAEMTVGEVA